jgi:hypothetical protein
MPDTKRMIQSLVEEHLIGKNFRFAKTMPKNPHYYTLKDEWESPKDFVKTAKGIFHFGEVERFKGKLYKVLHYEEWRYWTMSGQIYDEHYFQKDCILINRARIFKEDNPEGVLL